MGRLATQLIKQAPESIHTWKRVIDDIFIIWAGSIKEFMSNNQFHPIIKFTHEISDTALTFLDVILYKREIQINEHKIHIIATNKQLYVHSTSYHPTTIKAIAKGETKKYLRTNSNETSIQ